MRIGLDIGGTSVKGIVVDSGGAVVARATAATVIGPEGVLSGALGVVRELLADVAGPAATDRHPVVSIGVGVPGSVDAVRGRLEHAVNLGVSVLDLGPLLNAELGIPVRLENDVNAAAIGAHHARGGAARDSLALLNLGTGLACGLVIEGRLWRGGRGVAGEIGHIPVDPAGTRCTCGQIGCLETLCSGAAVARLWPSDDLPPAAAMMRAAAAGDQRAVTIRRDVVAAIALAVRLVALTVDVDVVVLAGGVSRLGDPLLALVRQALREAGRASSFIASLRLHDRVELAPSDVGALGAALLQAAPPELSSDAPVSPVPRAPASA